LYLSNVALQQKRVRIGVESFLWGEDMRRWTVILLLLSVWGLIPGDAFPQSTPVGNSVVSVGLLVIQPTSLPEPLDRFDGQNVFLPIAFGTGFVVSEDGYVVTARHVISRAERRLPNIQSAGKQMVVCLGASPEPVDCKEVKIVGTDDRNDLALLKIKRPKRAELPRALHLGSERPARGTEVWSAGYPARTGGRLVVAPGTFSSSDRSDDSVVESESAAPTLRMWLADMAVEDGASGGPVYLQDGSVIGVVVTRSVAHTVTGFVPAQRVIDLLVRNGVANLPTRDSRKAIQPDQRDTAAPAWR